jgi:hypothetical protein
LAGVEQKGNPCMARHRPNRCYRIHQATVGGHVSHRYQFDPGVEHVRQSGHIHLPGIITWDHVDDCTGAFSNLQKRNHVAHIFTA